MKSSCLIILLQNFSTGPSPGLAGTGAFTEAALRRRGFRARRRAHAEAEGRGVDFGQWHR